jgi:hypothetical protein
LEVLIAQVVNAHLSRSTQDNQQMLDQQSRQNSELQDYLSTVGQLPTNPDPAADTAAQAKTLTVLPDLNPDQKRTVVQFLYQADLIGKDDPRIRLFYADLTSANTSRGPTPKTISSCWTTLVCGALTWGTPTSNT